MKHIILCLLTFSIISFNIDAQCLQNGDFPITCTNTVTAPGTTCTTWSNNCGAGWIRSHGTPQMIQYCSLNKGSFCFDTSYYVYMWSALESGGIKGEGIFTPYNFQTNQTYQLTIRVSTSNSDATNNNIGSVFIYAANTLSQSTLTSNCGDLIPTISPTQKQFIGQINGVTGWQDFTFNVTANGNYTQLWIYPSANTNVQYNLGVMNVALCPSSCSTTGTIIYNSGTIPGNLSEAGQIYAGSTAGTGGSGTVVLQQSQSTLFVAANEIDLLPSFNGTVSSGTNFTAFIDPNYCEHDYNLRLPYDTITNVPLFQANESTQNNFNRIAAELNPSPEIVLNDENDKIKIYPTLNNGIVYITGNKKELTNAEFVVYNSLGKIVFESHNYSVNKAKLDLTYLIGGVYYLQVKNESASTTKKIIIQH